MSGHMPSKVWDEITLAICKLLRLQHWSCEWINHFIPHFIYIYISTHILRPQSLQWRHNKHDGVSNRQPHDSLLNHLFRPRSKKTSKLRVTGLCAGNSPVTVKFPTQRANNAENVPYYDVIMIHASNRAQWAKVSRHNESCLLFDWKLLVPNENTIVAIASPGCETSAHYATKSGYGERAKSQYQ